MNIKELKERYNNTTVLVRATLWFTICNFLQRGVGMITTPLYTRLLPAEEYGLTSTFTAWETVLFMVTSLCLYKALMNLYVKNDEKKRNDILSSLMMLGILVTGIWFFLFWVFKQKVSQLIKLPVTLSLCLFFSFIFNSIIQSWILHQRYLYNYKRTVKITFSMVFFSALFGIISVLFVSKKAEAKIIPYTAVMVVTGCLLFAKTLRDSKHIFDREVWKFSLSFCVPLLPHYLSEFVLQSSDKLMINYMCGLRDVAIYSVAYSVGGLLSIATSAIDSSFAPFEYEAIKNRNYNKLPETSNKVLAIVAVFIIGVIYFGEEIVLIFGGEKYAESTRLIVPICVGLFFNYEFRLFARVQEYFEHKATIVIPSILAAALNLVSNYIFIRLYGYQAAAYTTFVCYLVFCLVHYAFYKRVCVKDLGQARLYDDKTIFCISAGVIVSGIVIMYIQQYRFIKYGILIFVLAAFIYKRRVFINYLQKER